MNVLLTSAGRRNYLVGYFKDAMRLLGLQGRVFAADADPMAAALAEADEAFAVSPFQTAQYLNELLRICETKEIGLVVPLNDVELPILAAESSRFLHLGVRVAVSSPATVNNCFDKVSMNDFLQSIGCSVVRTYVTLDSAMRALDSGEISFPVVVKPRWGSGSIGLELAANRRELELAYESSSIRTRHSIISRPSSADPSTSVLVQEMINGVEYGLDIVNDLDGKNACVLARRKLRMRSGETDKAVTVVDEVLAAIGKRIGTELRHIGNLDCDIITSDAGCYVIDMNPRFGGGYPFSHMAGANIPASLLCWTLGRQPDPTWLRVVPGVAGAKCDRVVTIKRAVLSLG